jgi:hypothetical protein
MADSTPTAPTPCARCGAAVSGRFCVACGTRADLTPDDLPDPDRVPDPSVGGADFGTPTPGLIVPSGPAPPYGYPAHLGIAGPKVDTGFNGLAIASLVMALLWICGVGSLLAIVLGFAAIRQLRTSVQRGRGLAIAGTLLGAVGLAAVVAYFAYQMADGPLRDRSTGETNACLIEQRLLEEAVQQFAVDQGARPDSVDELVDAKVLVGDVTDNYTVEPGGRVVRTPTGAAEDCPP